jgi:hypothetical protein
MSEETKPKLELPKLVYPNLLETAGITINDIGGKAVRKHDQINQYFKFSNVSKNGVTEGVIQKVIDLDEDIQDLIAKYLAQKDEEAEAEAEAAAEAEAKRIAEEEEKEKTSPAPEIPKYKWVGIMKVRVK